MTAPDGSRLTRLDRTLWVDLDDVIAVETSIGQLQERRVTLTTRAGAVFGVVVGAKPGTGHPRTDEEKDAELDAWLRRLPPRLLEGLLEPEEQIAQAARDLGVDLDADDVVARAVRRATRKDQP